MILLAKRKTGMRIPPKRMRKLGSLGNERRRRLLLNLDGNLRVLKLIESKRDLKHGSRKIDEAALKMCPKIPMNVQCWVNYRVCDMANLWLDALLDEKVALDPTVLEWIERYEEDETAAMTEMVNFILRVIRPNYLAYVSVVDAPLKSAQKTSMSKTTSLTTSLKSKKPTNRYLLFSILLTF